MTENQSQHDILTDTDEMCQEPHKHTCLVSRAKAHILENDKLDPLCDIFKVLSDPTRMRIILALVDTEMCVCDLADVAESSQSNISHQLRQMRQTGIVKSRKEGKSVFYSLDDDHIKTIIVQAVNHVAHMR
ncbi:metalloregulator ArsR/SmtB family transcription factor [Neobittarella massiliensis]|uniref:ArsR/SmtB family transcription factor n=1 Tax=Neobittarella massiliensis (ex Bilen et al. 2018) TaxID=2041842 RepID=UPI001FB54857|nr:metalloregulator ArsR/SmtB family transcription factor [Neobittarella massiliensis]